MRHYVSNVPKIGRPKKADPERKSPNGAAFTRALHKGGQRQTEVEKLREARIKFLQMKTREDYELPPVTDLDAQYQGTPTFVLPPELMRYIHQ